VFRQWTASVRTATHLLARRPTPLRKLPTGKTSHFVSLRIDPSRLKCNLRRSAPMSRGSGTKKIQLNTQAMPNGNAIIPRLRNRG